MLSAPTQGPLPRGRSHAALGSGEPWQCPGQGPAPFPLPLPGALPGLPAGRPSAMARCAPGSCSFLGTLRKCPHEHKHLVALQRVCIPEPQVSENGVFGDTWPRKGGLSRARGGEWGSQHSRGAPHRLWVLQAGSLSHNGPTVPIWVDRGVLRAWPAQRPPLLTWGRQPAPHLAGAPQRSLVLAMGGRGLALPPGCPRFPYRSPGGDSRALGPQVPAPGRGNCPGVRLGDLVSLGTLTGLMKHCGTTWWYKSRGCLFRLLEEARVPRAGLLSPRPPHLVSPCRCSQGQGTPARAWLHQDQEHEPAGRPGPERLASTHQVLLPLGEGLPSMSSAGPGLAAVQRGLQ